MSIIRTLSLLIVALALPSCLERNATHPPAQTIIDNVTVLDGRGGKAMENMRVTVRAGRIAKLERAQGPVRDATTVLDGEDKFLLPGFIDMHAHLLLPRCDGSFDRQLSGKMIEQLLEFGITTVRSPGNPTVEGLAFRDELNAGFVRGPNALASAEILNDPNMTEQEIRTYVLNAMPHKPDYFKFHSRFPPKSVAVLLEAAHVQGVPVIGHLQRTATQEAMKLGVDHVTHAVDWSPEALHPKDRAAYERARAEKGAIKARLDWLKLLDIDSPQVAATVAALSRSGVSLDPTLVAYDSKFRDPTSPRYRQNMHVDRIGALREDWEECQGIAEDWSQADYDRWAELWPKLLAYVGKMHEAGVLLTTGSDITNPWVIPGESLHQEMEYLVEAGISPLDVLRTSGENASRALGREDIGVVATGRRADLVLLSRDPRQDIRNTRLIAWVMQRGEVVKRGRP